MIIFLVSLLTIMSGQTVNCAEMTGQDIIAKCFAQYRQMPYEREDTRTTVAYESGRSEQKSFTRWIFFDKSGEDKVIIKFTEPALDNGLGLLIWRHANREDEQWLKLPSFERTRKIALSNQGKYFGGIDVTYEDARQLIGERTQDFDYVILSEDSLGWKVEAKPKPDTKSGYGKRVFTIRHDFACEVIEYFDKKGELLKKQNNQEITMQANGLWRTDKIIIVNRLLKRSTEIKILNRKFKNVSINTFTQEFLLRKE